MPQTNNPASRTWYGNKACLLAAHPEPPIILSRDKEHTFNPGSKEYTIFDTQEELLDFLEANHGGSYNEVAAGSHPCCMYVDVDRPSTHDSTDVILHAFAQTFQRFMRDIYGLKEFTLDLGSMYQVCCASRPGKVSAHVRINIACDSIFHAKTVRQDYEAFLRSAATSQADRDLLFYDCEDKDGKVKKKCVADHQVYSNFQNFRTIYSHKRDKPDSTLQPYGESSHATADHLVYYSMPDALPRMPHLENPPSLPANPVAPDVINVRRRQQTTSRQSATISPQDRLPADTLGLVKILIERSPEISSLLGCATPTIERIDQNSAHRCNFEFPARSHVCPYAGKQHASNRGYIRYDHRARTLTYKCFDLDCHDAQSESPYVFDIIQGCDDNYFLADRDSIRTLHCRQTVIPWTTTYAESEMRPYDDGRVVCIRGNMGSAKTKVLNTSFIPARFSDGKTTGIFITYSRALARKYAAQLEAIGFVNYLDHTSDYDLPQGRLIVCLDSLIKVTTKSFDYVFIDEALSVMLHFNSNLMVKRVGHVSNRFQDLLVNARHLFFLDACVDNALVYNVVRHITDHCGIMNAQWVHNTYVMPSNRRATVIRNLRGGDAMILAAIDKVIALLKQGLNVVACSSVVKFTELLIAKVAEQLPDVKAYVYNSDRAAPEQPPEVLWPTLHLLTYSPSISAGLSFETKHFDQLVAYLVNSEHTPTVDISLQQLFRVRELRHGQMTIYLQDKAYDRAKCPYLEADVDTFLDRSLTTVSRDLGAAGVNVMDAVPTFTDDKGRLRYDKRTLSYMILRGIVTNTHKSRMRYAELLTNTLREDYDIPCTMTEFTDDTKDSVTRCTEMKREWQSIKQARREPFAKDLLINSQQYAELRRRRQKDAKGQSLTDREKAMMWTYECVHDLWRVPPIKVDQAFYDQYICPTKGREDVYKQFYAALRTYDAMRYTPDENLQRRCAKISNVSDNLQLFNEARKNYFTRLIYGQRLALAVFGADCFQRLWNGGAICMKLPHMAQRVKAFLASLTDAEHDDALSTYDLREKEKYRREALLVSDDKKHLTLLRNALRTTFMVEIRDAPGSTRRKSAESYGSKQVFCPWLSINNQYQPRSLGYIAPDESAFDDTLDADYATTRSDTLVGVLM